MALPSKTGPGSLLPDDVTHRGAGFAVFVTSQRDRTWERLQSWAGDEAIKVMSLPGLWVSETRLLRRVPLLRPLGWFKLVAQACWQGAEGGCGQRLVGCPEVACLCPRPASVCIEPHGSVPRNWKKWLFLTAPSTHICAKGQILSALLLSSRNASCMHQSA